MLRRQQHAQQAQSSLDRPRQQGRMVFQVDTQALNAAGVVVAAASDPGCIRDQNEDYLGIYTAPPDAPAAAGLLAVLADGMGGHAAGEIASEVAVSTIAATFYQADVPQSVDTTGDGTTDAAHRLYAGFLAADHAIRRAGQRSRDQQGMGCTCIAAALWGHEIILSHVGDTRAYLIQPAADARGQKSLSSIRQFTADHSFAAELVRAGVLTEEEARHSSRRHTVHTRVGWTA